MKKIGIYGGSFDPVHLGHINLALQAKEQLKLEKILFVPVKHQPFKLNRQVTAEEHRVGMLKAAIEDRNDMEISYEELKNDEISYTFNTLMRIRRNYDELTEIFFLLGTDALLSIEHWHQADELLKNFSFAIGIRPGYKEEELKICIDRIREVYNTNIVILNNKKLPISSTEIKDKVKKGEPLDKLVPTAVERYIHEHGLYK